MHARMFHGASQAELEYASDYLSPSPPPPQEGSHEGGGAAAPRPVGGCTLRDAVT